MKSDDYLEMLLEEFLDKKNSMGAKDLTAYNAVKQIVTNGNVPITWR